MSRSLVAEVLVVQRVRRSRSVEGLVEAVDVVDFEQRTELVVGSFAVEDSLLVEGLVVDHRTAVAAEVDKRDGAVGQGIADIAAAPSSSLRGDARNHVVP